MKFSIGQKKVLSDILNNMATGFLAAGIIAPFFSPTMPLNELFSSITLSLSASCICVVYSLMIMKGVNQ